jgi:hypothetical protein
LEEAIHREVDLLCKKEHHSILDIIQRTTFIGIARKEPIYKAHNLENLSLQQGQVLERLLNSAKEQYLHTKVTLTFEIEAIVPIPTKLSSKRKGLETNEEGSSLPLLSPPAIHEKKKLSRTSV